eukprot:3584430-Prymnesium_polylepis.1
MARRSRGGMGDTRDIFVASKIAFGRSRVAFSRFSGIGFATVARAELRSTVDPDTHLGWFRD